METNALISIWQCADNSQRSAIIVLATALAAGASPVPVGVVEVIFSAAHPTEGTKRYDAFRGNYELAIETIIVEEVPVDVFPSLQPTVIMFAALLVAEDIALLDPPCRQRDMPNLP